MDRKLYYWISALVRDKPNQATSRSISQLGRQVLAHYGCGHIRNNRLIFSAEDKRNLRQQVMEEMGLDPFTTEQLPAERLEMAKFHANEKLAAKPAGHDHLLLNSADGVICVNNEQIRLYPESLASAGLLCLSSSIETIEHDVIVVVENLPIMSLCHAWRLPCIDRQALWVYRGDHKSGAKADTCRDFVERFGAGKTVVIFSDMDPAGLKIALTVPHVDYWLGPEQAAWRACLRSKLANRRGFDLQADALAYLERLSDEQRLSGFLNELLTYMQEERSSFRQEHMFSHDIKLGLFKVE